jgi:uncharacterized protein (DUF3084 family)
LDFDAAYSALPAFDAPDGPPTPAVPSPAATPDVTEPVLTDEDDGSLDLRVPEPEGTGEDEEAPDSDDGAEDADGAEPEDDRDWLIERAQRADELEREFAQQKASRQEAEAVAYWDDRLDKANKAFAAREEVIYQNAEQSLNGIAYLRTEMAKLNNEANAWYGQYRDNREQALWQFAHAQAIPQHAARVADHYKLPQEAVNELLDYPPDQMEREAQKMRKRLIKERTTQKQIDQLRRKEAARKIAAATVAPGSGRGASGAALSEMSFEDGYASIPWSRGR